ncbi:MAG: hypothetical protein ABSF00_07350 [Candidatus Bathyarchaeia archaeon]
MLMNAGAILGLKLVTVPIFIFAVSIVARRWGASVGGLIIGLPLTSGPVLFFLTLEQGSNFASGAAQGTLMALISLASSCLAYSLLSFRFSWRISFVGCCTAYLIASSILYFVSAPLVLSLVGVLAFLGVIWRVMPPGSVGGSSRKPPAWEIPTRMVSATAMVLLITESATFLGPHFSGLLTPFPVYATILAVFIHKFDGPGASAQFLRGVTVGCSTSAVFFFLIASFIVTMGIFQTFALGVVVALTLQGLLLYSLRRGRAS